jgi:mannose-6-phosphate isomerase-like protein (cupin superfamily)
MTTQAHLQAHQNHMADEIAEETGLAHPPEAADAAPRADRRANDPSEGQVLGPGEGTVVPLPGATMVWKALSGRASGDFVVGEFTAQPGFAGPRPHVHRTHEELFYVLEGEFDFLVGERTVRLGAGAFVAVPPGVAHDFRNPTARPARWLGIACPGGLDRYFAEVGALVAEGRFSEEALRELRLKYDTDELERAPAGHWSWGEERV